MTCYFHFPLDFPRGSGKQMSDNGMWDRAEGCVPPASLCTLSVGPLYGGQSECHAFPKHSPTPLGQAVWSSHYQSNMSNHQCFSPHMYNKKIWLQLLLHPKGNFQNSSPPHLSEMKLSRFLRFAEICLLILNHTGFHWLHDQDKCLSYLFMSLKMTLQLGDVETWLQTLMLCWLWVRVS